MKIAGKLTKTLFSDEQIKKRVQDLGHQISQDYQGEPIVVIGVLKGAVVFMADLIRTIQAPIELEFMGVSSYEGTASTGHVKINHDLSRDVHDCHVLIVEDIIDTGLTIDYLINLIKVRGPKSIKVCSLLSKPESYQMQHPIDYVGFEITKEFVVGYGLDLDGKYRELPEILQLMDD